MFIETKHWKIPLLVFTFVAGCRASIEVESYREFQSRPDRDSLSLFYLVGHCPVHLSLQFTRRNQDGGDYWFQYVCDYGEDFFERIALTPGIYSISLIEPRLEGDIMGGNRRRWSKHLFDIGEGKRGEVFYSGFIDIRLNDMGRPFNNWSYHNFDIRIQDRAEDLQRIEKETGLKPALILSAWSNEFQR
ncbi:MAG: hypothetical protein KDK27_17475 [Leptospiraceae bacterium]|nr:hypothetical protein [Leptospiraceae bacterium]